MTSIKAGAKKPALGRLLHESIGRGDRIRTCDLYVPNVALYQTELHPDAGILKYFPCR
jgi:hypothetical protein